MSLQFDFNTLWSEVLYSIRDEIGTTSYDIWFSLLKIKKVVDNKVYISVPNIIVKDWINNKYLDLMKNKLKSISNEDYIFFLEIENQAKKQKQESYLNPRYRFDNFVVGNSNRFAHAACFAVGESPGRAYNPLFIYGGVGLGKTHLMQAVGHEIRNKKNDALIVYVSSEQFTNELIGSIKDDKTAFFRNKYRNVDILLMDDIQFLEGKERTQEEFFHTFNTLYEANKQIVISSDRPPRNIKTLEDRLRSRFEWGLITDIQPPDFETRVAILRKKAQNDNIEVPYDILDYIASIIQSNIRELEGALIRLAAYTNVNNKELSLSTAEEALKEILPPLKPQEITIESIQNIICEHFSISLSELNSKKRNKHLVYPRQIAMYLCRHLTEASFPQIGEQFGGKDHTTVMHSADKIEKSLINDADLEKLLAFLINKIQHNYKN